LKIPIFIWIFARIFNPLAGDGSHWTETKGLPPAISSFAAFSLDSGNPAKLLQPQMSLASRDLLYRFMLS